MNANGTRMAAITVTACVGATAMAQQAVQWRVEDGGNGHWYRGDRGSSLVSWSQARAASVASGASLACIGNEQESQWIFDRIASDAKLWANSGGYVVGPWIGGRGAAGAWRWDDETPWRYSSWYRGEGPPSSDPTEQFAYYFNGVGTVTPANQWGDYFDVAVTHSYILEWSADCNSDGVVDFGQILAGELADANGNNIPDCCESGAACGCAADLDGNGGVDGIDLAIILNRWGTDGGKDYPNADIDGNGTIDGADLAQILGSWGNCP